MPLSSHGTLFLAVAVDEVPVRTEREVAEKILKRTHEVCPYSNATRGNIEVTLKVV
jgi:osmotically inducible protein OsmC